MRPFVMALGYSTRARQKVVKIIIGSAVIRYPLASDIVVLQMIRSRPPSDETEKDGSL